jgi:hypothetical protein
LWEEVRAALTATRITRDRRAFPITISRFKRVFHPKSLQVQSEERNEQSGMASNPFLSMPILVLSTKGYIVTEASGELTYHAPDVDVLLSEIFVRDHCFSLVEGTGARAALVGLAFRPTSARKVPDITGVLWVDGPTRELRRLEFNYTGDPYEGLWQRFPSYMEYTRLPSGAWIIGRWAIRMPLIEVSRPDPTVPGGGGGSIRRLAGIVEQGAEASIGDGRPRIPRALAGVVFDSTAGRPLAGARVALRGTPFGATSDDAGRFRIQLPDTGRYLLAFEHPRLDSLGYDVRAREIRVTDSLTTADVAVPPFATVRAELCPGSRGGASTGVVVGTVRTATGALAGWATLRYTWSRLDAGPSGPQLQSTPGATLVTDSRGRFLVCDVPSGRYRIRLESEAREAAEVELSIEPGQIATGELRLGPRG